MKIYDISLKVTPSLPTWPGDPAIQINRVDRMEDGSSNNLTHIAMSAHTGTHVDAPFHFVAGGATIEQLPLDILTGRAYVLHLPDVELITADVLKKAEIPPRTRRILFKTRNSHNWQQPGLPFQTDFVALSPDGAAYLVERSIRLVGVDYFSVAPFHQSVPTHETLLGAGVVVLEGVDLSNVPPGRYMLYCLPLNLVGSDGAPARAILIGV